MKVYRIEKNEADSHASSCLGPTIVGFHLYYKYARLVGVRQTSMAEVFVTIKVLFFASAREAAGGVSFADVELPVGSATTTTLRRKLAEIYPDLESMVVDEDNIALALNEEYVTAGQELGLKSGDTVALIPPISGG